MESLTTIPKKDNIQQLKLSKENLICGIIIFFLLIDED